MAKYWQNKKFSEKHKESLRLGWIKRKEKGLGIAWNKNIPWSEESKEKMRLAHTGKILSEEHKRKIKENAKQNPNFGMKNKKQTQEAKDKITLKNIERWKDKKNRKKFQDSMQKHWNNPKHWKKVLSTNSPNKEEIQLSQMLTEILPNEYSFVGNGKLRVGRKFPDFVNQSNDKLIELYGDYYHKGQNPQDRIDYFQPFGYDTLVIWASELKSDLLVKNKILKFNNV